MGPAFAGPGPAGPSAPDPSSSAPANQGAPGGSGPPINQGGTNVVSVTGNQTVALTDNGDQITGDAGANNITVTGSPNTGDFVDGGAGSNTLTLGAQFSAVSGSGLGVKNIETVAMSGASNKTIIFAPYDVGSATVNISADGNGGDKYLTSDGNPQNQILNFGSGVNGLKSGDIVDLGAGTGDKVVLAGQGPNVASLSNVEIVITGFASDTVNLTSSSGSSNLISASDNDTYNLTNSAGGDVIAFSSIKTNVNVTGFNAAIDKLRFERGDFGDFKGDADGDGIIDSSKLRTMNPVGSDPQNPPGLDPVQDADDFWIFDLTTKKTLLRFGRQWNRGTRNCNRRFR